MNQRGYSKGVKYLFDREFLDRAQHENGTEHLRQLGYPGLDQLAQFRACSD